MTTEDLDKRVIAVETDTKRIKPIEEENSRTQQRLSDAEIRLKERDTITNGYIFSKIITGTTSASAGTETTHTHTLKRDPSFVFITSKSNGVVYLTDKDKDNIKVKGSASSLDFTAYLLA